LRRVYRAKNWSKVFCLVFLAFSLVFSVGAWRGISVGTNTWFDLAVGLVLVLVGAGFAAQTFTVEVALTDDSIRHGSIFRSQSMRLDQIRYRREYEEDQRDGDGGTIVHYLEFVPRESNFQSLRISKDDFELDSAFWEWALRVPEIEQLESNARSR
jgi:hypothetical protein